MPARTLQLRNPSGESINIEQNYVFSAFNSVMENISLSLNREVEQSAAHGLRVLIVTPETFRAIRTSNLPPDWVGVYEWWDGTVVYRSDYITSVLGGNGNFGGYDITPQYFYEEAGHELLHSYESAIFFGNDEDMSRHFTNSSRWLVDGLKEAMARHHTGLSDAEFASGLNDILTAFPEYSIQAVSNNFWKYDSSPTHRNITYQYCGRFLRYLAPIVSKRFIEKGVDLDPTKEYQGVYQLLNEAVKRYKAGKRESIADAMADPEVLGLPREELFRIEKEWVDGVLKQE